MSLHRSLTPVAICADDFGIEAGVDEAIIELSRHGRLSATSCLTTATGFAERASLLNHAEIDLGVHLNFTEFLGAPGLYQPLSTLLVNSYLRKLSPAAVDAQIAEQLDAFERYLGRTPDFIDGHLHVHQFPVIRDALMRQLLARYKKPLPWLRNTKPGHLSNSLPFVQRVKAHVIAALGARALSNIARKHGVQMNRDFLGAYDFSGTHPPYAVMLDAWLAQALPGTLLMAHPARYVSADDLFGQGRVEEYRILSSDLFSLLLEQHQVKITRLSEVLSSAP